MAAEASLTDQEAHKQVDVNVDDDIKYDNEEIIFQPKALEGKKEEELKVEDAASVEAPVTEHTPNSAETSDTPDVKSEEKIRELSGEATEKEPVTGEAEQKGLSNDVSDALVEDVKKEEEEKESESEATEKEPVSEASEQNENSDDLSNTLVEDAKKEGKTGEFPQKESYSDTTEQIEISDNSNDALIKPVTEEAEQKGVSKDVSDALVEDVKKEEKESEGEATEKEPVPESVEQKENSDDLSDTLVEDVKKEEKMEGEFTKEESYSEKTEQKEISDDSNAALIEDVKKEEGKQEHEGEATEKELDSEATEQKENSGDLIDALVEDVNKKEEKKESEGEATEKEPGAEAPKQTENSGDSVDALVDDVKDEDGRKEHEDLATQKEPDSEAAEETTETTQVALIQESEVELANDPEVPDTDIKTENHVPSTSEIKEKEVETPAASTVEEDALDISAAPDVSETPEATVVQKILPEVVASSVPSKEESTSDVISDLVASASDISNATSSDPEKFNEVKDAGAVVPVVPDAPLNTNDKPPADDSVIEESPRCETKVVKEEKATEGQDSTFSESLEAGVAQIAEVLSGGGGAEKSEGLVETSKDIDTTTVSKVSNEAEKASAGVDLVMEDNNLEGDKTTLVETSKDLVVDSSVNDDSKEADSQPNAAESIESITDKSGDKKDESEKADDAKGDDQLATPVKSSQKHSSSLISKVKQSIVKVKKAIIGKSSSSKTLLQENKDDIKDK